MTTDAQRGDFVPTLRVVHDHSPGLADHLCLKWLHDADGQPRSLCCLPPGHVGTCLTFPRFPRKTVTADNPAWTKEAA